MSNKLSGLTPIFLSSSFLILFKNPPSLEGLKDGFKKPQTEPQDHAALYVYNEHYITKMQI